MNKKKLLFCFNIKEITYYKTSLRIEVSANKILVQPSIHRSQFLNIIFLPFYCFFWTRIGLVCSFLSSVFFLWFLSTFHPVLLTFLFLSLIGITCTSSSKKDLSNYNYIQSCFLLHKNNKADAAVLYANHYFLHFVVLKIAFNPFTHNICKTILYI